MHGSSSPEYQIRGFSFTKRGRFDKEFNQLTAAWSTLAVLKQNDGSISKISGTLEPTPGTIRDFQIIVPLHYPYDEPKAYSVGWDIAGPHVYPDNRMCLWPINHWHSRRSLAYAVSKTFVWIHKYEVYLATKNWPGNQQVH